MANIRCGNCHEIHRSVAEVRSCYEVKPVAAVMALHTIRGDVDVPVLDTKPVNVEPKPASTVVPTEMFYGATEKQIDFIKKLGDDRDYSKLDGQTVKAEGLEYHALRLYQNVALEGGLVSKKAASALIDMMLDLPFPAKTVKGVTGFESVPDGRYAIDNASGKGIVFYKVYTRRNGSRGVSLQVSDDFIPVRLSDVTGVLERIEVDVEGAFARYGREIGKCGVCNRTLTQQDSIDRGIGPKCASKLGF